MSPVKFGVLLLGVYLYRSEGYTPKDFFKSPIQVGRWWRRQSCTQHS